MLDNTSAHEWLERYLASELSPEERTRFEAQLAVDADLAAHLEVKRAVLQGIYIQDFIGDLPSESTTWGELQAAEESALRQSLERVESGLSPEIFARESEPEAKVLPLAANDSQPEAESLKPEAEILPLVANDPQPEAESLKPEVEVLPLVANDPQPEAESLKPEAEILPLVANDPQPEAESLKPEVEVLPLVANDLKPEAESLKPEAESLKLVPPRRRAWRFLAAASLLFCLAFGAWWALRPESNEVIFARHFAPPAATMSRFVEQELGAAGFVNDRRPLEQLRDGMRACEQTRYAEAIPLIEAYLSSAHGVFDPRMAELYLGVAYLGKGDARKALEPLAKARTFPILQAEADWYRALAYLRLGEPREAKPLLELLRSDKVHSKQAEVLLKSL